MSELNGSIEPMEFDCSTRLEVPVRIGDGKYLLLEADGTAMNAFHACVLRGAKTDENGKIRPGEGVFEANVVLLSHCLVEAGTRTAVTPQFVRELPNRISKPLVERLKRISGMDDEAPKKPGKSEDPSTTGSS